MSYHYHLTPKFPFAEMKQFLTIEQIKTIVQVAMFVKCVNADYEKTHSLEESVENCYKKMIA